jgi:DNA-binding MarR family transcriptional regulator
MNEIASDALLLPPTLTKVVDRLVAANLVHRRSDPLDRRRVLILLTPRGRSLRQRLDRIVQQHHQSWSDVLGESGLGQLTDLLDRLRHVTG